jgi:hypothetical protein
MIKKHIVVIGAGLAGTLICNELVEKCDVTLLEAGEKDRIGYPGITFTNKPLAAVKTMCIGGGGTTNLWHNGLMPIHGEDVTSSEFRTLLVDVERYMNKAARNLYWVDDPYTAEYEKIVSQMNLMAKDTGVFSDGIDCLLYPKKYKRLEVDSRVNACYSVTDIDFVPKGKSIQSINYSAAHLPHSIEADTIILSAGALGSPWFVRKILSAIGHSGEKAGTGFMDHPIGFVGKVKFKKNVNELIKRFALLDKGNYECRTAVRLKSACGRYTCAAFFRPALTMGNNLSIYKYKSLLGASSGVDRIKNVFSFRIFHPDILAEIVSHLFSMPIPGRIYNVFLVFEQKRGGSNVTYNENGLVMDWRITEEESSVYNNVLDKLLHMLSGIADEINIKTDIEEDWLWSHAHHSGTISLGKTADSCVDLDLKLHSCDNVFVCDGSIIQEHSYANTGLTIGQLAMRLAERVSN